MRTDNGSIRTQLLILNSDTLVINSNVQFCPSCDRYLGQVLFESSQCVPNPANKNSLAQGDGRVPRRSQ
jgi:hypothetical protein